MLIILIVDTSVLVFVKRAYFVAKFLFMSIINLFYFYFYKLFYFF